MNLSNSFGFGNGLGTSGTVSSVGLAMPSPTTPAFTVSNSPVTGSGTLTVTANGSTSQYVRGDGSLASFPSLTGYVPYTGATADVSIGNFSFITNRTLSLTATDGNSYIQSAWQSASPAGVASTTTMWFDSTGRINWRPSTGASSYVRTFDAMGLTANRVWTLPDASGTIALTTAIGTSGTDVSWSAAGGLLVPSASATARGVVTTASQTFTGDKTFTGSTYANHIRNGSQIGAIRGNEYFSGFQNTISYSATSIVVGVVGTSGYANTAMTIPVSGNGTYGGIFGTYSDQGGSIVVGGLFYAKSDAESVFGARFQAIGQSYLISGKSCYGVYVDSVNSLYDNNYGLYINSVINGTNNWGVYQVGGTKNYFNGSVGFGTTSINASSLADFTSTTKGVLFPRMTTIQKNAISLPPSGLVIYDTNLGKLCVRGAINWETITSV